MAQWLSQTRKLNRFYESGNGKNDDEDLSVINPVTWWGLKTRTGLALFAYRYTVPGVTDYVYHPYYDEWLNGKRYYDPFTVDAFAMASYPFDPWHPGNVEKMYHYQGGAFIPDTTTSSGQKYIVADYYNYSGTIYKKDLVPRTLEVPEAALNLLHMNEETTFGQDYAEFIKTSDGKYQIDKDGTSFSDLKTRKRYDHTVNEKGSVIIPRVTLNYNITVWYEEGKAPDWIQKAEKTELKVPIDHSLLKGPVQGKLKTRKGDILLTSYNGDIAPLSFDVRKISGGWDTNGGWYFDNVEHIWKQNSNQPGEIDKNGYNQVYWNLFTGNWTVSARYLDVYHPSICFGGGSFKDDLQPQKGLLYIPEVGKTGPVYNLLSDVQTANPHLTPIYYQPDDKKSGITIETYYTLDGYRIRTGFDFMKVIKEDETTK